MSREDFGAVLTLQRAAFVDEARIYETPFVPALDETLEELTQRLDTSTSWVADDSGRIVGAVSLRGYREGGHDVERLMVAPDRRGQGIAGQLLSALEQYAKQNGHSALQLIVGDLATSNIEMYRHLGWAAYQPRPLKGFEHVLVRSMSKRLT